METLFTTIQEAIALQMPSLTLVDEDYGQMEYAGDSYPVTFPCVLIGIDGIKWDTITPDYQKGDGNITIKLCIDCYNDTHYSGETANKTIARFLMFKELHNIVRRIKISDDITLDRISSRFPSYPGGIKVYQSTYRFDIDEDFEQVEDNNNATEQDDNKEDTITINDNTVTKQRYLTELLQNALIEIDNLKTEVNELKTNNIN